MKRTEKLRGGNILANFDNFAYEKSRGGKIQTMHLNKPLLSNQLQKRASRFGRAESILKHMSVAILVQVVVFVTFYAPCSSRRKVVRLISGTSAFPNGVPVFFKGADPSCPAARNSKFRAMIFQRFPNGTLRCPILNFPSSTHRYFN